MARLLDRLLPTPAVRSNLPDPETVSMLQSTWAQGTSEQILQTFRSYAISAAGANAVVFSCILQRVNLIAQAEFKFQDLASKRLFGNPDLTVLEQPWRNGTTGDLLARMEQHNSIGGQAFVRRAGDTLVVMRPDWVDVVSADVVEGVDDYGRPRVHSEVLGYLYTEGGHGVGQGVFYPVEEVAHWTPMPDPLRRFTGMSWLTPVLREINADTSMVQHRQMFFDAAATPNLVLKYQQTLNPQTFQSIKERWQARFAGPIGAGSTVVLDQGADLTVVGSTFESMRFTDVQAAGEARIAGAAGVPAIVAGLQAGLDAATYSNYGMAMRAFAAGQMAMLWQSTCAALAKLVNVPAGARLWYDTTSIPALREDEQARAVTMQTLAAAASTLLTAGYEAESITAALVSGDLTLLKHTGLVSVQLYKAAAAKESSLPVNGIPVDTAPQFTAPKLPMA